MKQKFHIDIQRASARTYEVIAESREEAEELALDMAYNEDWATEEAAYMVY